MDNWKVGFKNGKGSRGWFSGSKKHSNSLSPEIVWSEHCMGHHSCHCYCHQWPWKSLQIFYLGLHHYFNIEVPGKKKYPIGWAQVIHLAPGSFIEQVEKESAFLSLPLSFCNSRWMITDPKVKIECLLFQVVDKYIIQENFTRKLNPKCTELGHLLSLRPFLGSLGKHNENKGANGTHSILENPVDFVRCYGIRKEDILSPA